MEYQVTCACGKVLWVSERTAGSSASCPCGREVPVPSLGELRGQAITAVPPPVPAPPPSHQPLPGAETPAEIIAPTPITLRTERPGQPARAATVTAALTTHALWLLDTWRLEQVPLPALGDVEPRRRGRELVLLIPRQQSVQKLTLTFASADAGWRWYRELEARRQQLGADAAPADGHVPEGVALVRRASDVPHRAVALVEFSAPDRRTTDRGLQLRAGMYGADAVIAVRRRKCSESGQQACHASGSAVRVEDPADRQRLRRCWWAEIVAALAWRMVLLLAIQLAVLLLASVFCVGATSLHQAVAETPLQALASSGLRLGLFFAWPLVLLVLLRLLGWPLLLRLAGLTVLVATTVRGLTVMLAHLLALRVAGHALTGKGFWLLVDPVNWPLILAGVVLCARSWRLAGDAVRILPSQARTNRTARRAWGWGLSAATVVYAILFVGLIGSVRYHMSAYLLQPGVDLKAEREATLAMNEGMHLLDKGELPAAEQSLQRALQLWEELTANPAAPPHYHVNLSLTLFNLGWIRHRQSRPDEAEKYYARCVAVGDELVGDPRLDGAFLWTLAEARRVLAELHDARLEAALKKKDKEAGRKYEQAAVAAEKGDGAAEGLYQDALAAWEEILPQATNEDYRKYALARLAAVHLELGELHRKLDKLHDAEQDLRKAIDYGEKAVALDPDRPLPKHNLEVSRRMLDRVREHSHQQEIDKLVAAERFAAAAAACARGVTEQEERVRAGQDREAAVRLLAMRLDRYARLLAHCPDRRVRDTRAAVAHARRATELQAAEAEHWYTLALVQHRNGDWRDSQASLEQVKARQGEFEATGWFLAAMNLHRLRRPDEARDAFRKGTAWIDERRRQGRDNVLLRFQFETAQPAIEALQREAEQLLAGKEPAVEKPR
jgi:tetratricopeptide (TPR) repeat protein